MAKINIMKQKTFIFIALDAFPDKAETYINYSALLIDTGRAGDAKKYLTKANFLIMSSFEHANGLTTWL